jgi:hypothetical protein
LTAAAFDKRRVSRNRKFGESHSYSSCIGGDVASNTRALSEQERKTYARFELFLF